MADLYTHAFADNVRVAKSFKLIGLADDTYNIIRIPRYAFVKGVYLWLSAALAGDTVSVGFLGNGESADVDYFLTTAEAAASATGYKNAPRMKYFADASGAITFTVSTIGTGVGFVFAEYSVIY